MQDALSSRLQWAAIWGFCFLLSIVIQQSVFRAASELQGITLSYFAFTIVMPIFFMTFILHIRGYAHLGEKYDLPLLQWLSHGFILVLVALCVGNFADIYYLGSVGGDDTFIKAFIGASFLFYIAGFAGLGFATLQLRDRLGPVAGFPNIVGSVILAYALYSLAPAALFGFSPPQFLGHLIWVPIPEALFVIAGIVLFFRAAGDTL